MGASNTELTEKYKGLLQDPLEAVRVEHCNHKPHPFMIGPAHVADAADHHGGMLGETTMNTIGCVWQDDRYDRRCGRLLREHTSDHVLFVKVTRDCANKEVARALFAIKEQMLADKLDGVAFFQTPYTIAPPEPEEARDALDTNQ